MLNGPLIAMGSPGATDRASNVVYVEDVDATLDRLVEATNVEGLREAEDMPWRERIATIGDPEGNPVALCQEK
jgi:predicted enzyme related to lactoylglutathione lyase